MKLKYILLALTACTMTSLSAQTAAPAKEKATEEIVPEPKAETPVEKVAFKMFDAMNAIPEILGGITDEKSVETADAKIDALVVKIKEFEKDLLKLEVPDNDARKALNAKMEIKMASMQEKMIPVIMQMGALPPEVAMKLGPMMQKLQVESPEADKYFKTDEELKAQKGE